MANNLDARAEGAGILLEPRWPGAPPVPNATKEALLAALGDPMEETAAEPFPGQAFVPPVVDERRLFGVSLQLYQLRSHRNLGIGDLGDLRSLIDGFAREGCDFIGLNPLHALFTAAPERASPFSPSDRRFLNPLIIAVDAVPGYRPQMREGVSVPGSGDQVDYTAAARAKLIVLRRVHATWRTGGPDITQGDIQAAARHRSEAGNELEDFALFEALSHAMVRDGCMAGWTGWPAQYRTREGAAVRAFREAHANDIAFFAWLQYVAASQLDAAQAHARRSGMAIGLYLDLAVGSAPDGAATWADPGLVMAHLRVGAPPDLFSAQGQNWGLAPLSPTALRREAFASHKAVLGAVMEAAGAVRIDHVMGVERLYLIPEGASALDGAYVKMDGQLRSLLGASQAHETLVIGEDLGVVPAGFRDRMAARRIFSTRIVPFERDGEVMRALETYPADSLACFSTHDLAPLEAWWLGEDILVRRSLGLLSGATLTQAENERNAERRLVLALAGLDETALHGPPDSEIAVAIHRLAARSASRLAAIRLEDVVGGRRLVNLPGTDREHPNWRNTLPMDVDEIGRSERLSRVFAAMREGRSG